LLGSKESDVHVIWKQLKAISVDGVTEEARVASREKIRSNVLQHVRNLASVCQALGVKQTEELMRERALTRETVDKVNRLWRNPIIKEALRRRCEELDFSARESAEHFLDSIDRYVSDDFQVTDADLLALDTTNMGVREVEFAIEDFSFLAVDSTGQRGEMKKWLPLFQDFTMVIFCAPLDGFDLHLPEDPSVNHMWETLKNFDMLMNCSWFADTAFLLMFTRRDVFEEKIKRGVSLRNCFPEFSGNTVEEAYNFLRNKFLSRGRSRKSSIYTHITVGGNCENIRVIYNTVKNVVWLNSIDTGGFNVVEAPAEEEKAAEVNGGIKAN